MVPVNLHYSCTGESGVWEVVMVPVSLFLHRGPFVWEVGMVPVKKHYSVCPKASALLLQQCCKNLRFFCILAKVRAWPWAQGPGPGPGTWMLDDGAPGTEVQDLDF